MQTISKSFPGVNALNIVDFDLYPGEVHALIGENGAGKSVLLKILNGVYCPDAGHILFKGSPVQIASEKAAHKLGIVMIHQELNPLLDLSSADNIFLNHYPVKGFMVDKKKLYQQTQALFEMLDMRGIQPSTIMGTMTMAQIQMVEIAKAFAFDAEVIVMDEPTTSLSDKEVKTILQIIHKLREKGVAIILTSHKLNEVLQIADRITVLRDGQVVDCRPAANMNHNDLIIMMAGHKINELSRDAIPKHEAVRLSVEGLCADKCFQDISFKLYAGEILCLAGLVGARKTEVAQALFGLRKISRGKICVNGKSVRIRTPHDAIKHKIAYVPEDRKMQGLFLKMPISFNLSVTNLEKLSRFFYLDRSKEKELATNNMKRFGIKANSPASLVQNLSGGGQQKVVLAKWLERGPDILIMDDPTRGIDVGARQEIYGIINELAKQGKAILLVSSDIQEITTLSDRVVVMNEGKIKAVLNKEEINQENIMRYAVQFD